MTLNEIYLEFMGRREGTTLLLGMDFPDDTVRSVLFPFGVEQIALYNSEVHNQLTGIEIIGETSFPYLQNGSRVVITLQYQQVEDHPDLVKWNLEIGMQGSYPIETLIGPLPDSRVTEGVIFERTESVLTGTSIQYPKITLTSQNVFKDLPFGIQGTLLLPGGDRWSKYVFLQLGNENPFGGYFAFMNPFQIDRQAQFAFEMPLVTRLQIGEKDTFDLKLYMHSGVEDPYGEHGDVITSVTLACEMNLQNVSTPVKFAIPLFRQEDRWKFLAQFENGLSLSDFVNFITGLFGGGTPLLPPNTPLDYFKLYQLQIGTLYNRERSFDVTDVQVLAGSSRRIVLPIPWISLDQISMLWLLSGKMGAYLYTAHLTGTMSFQLGDTVLVMSASAMLPSMDLQGSLSWRPEEDYKPVETVTLTNLTSQFGVTAPAGWGADSKDIAHLDLEASFERRTFSTYGEVNGVIDFEINKLPIKLEKLYASAFVSDAEKEFVLGGVLGFGEGERYFSLYAQGSYTIAEQSYWTFRGGLKLGSANLGYVLSGIFGLDPQGASMVTQILNINLEELAVEYSSENGYFSIVAGIGAGWRLTLLGSDFQVKGKLTLRQESQGDLFAAAMFGMKIGIFQLVVQANDFFYSDRASYMFRAYLNQLYIQGSYAKKSGDEILSFSMGGMSLGELIESFVQMLNPYSKFQLPAPWNLLNRIELSRFFLVINATKNTASFYYLVDVTIAGLMYIEKVGLTYEKDSGNGHIKMLLTGRLLEENYDDENPLSWDVVNGKPPEASAVGEQILELYYIGMGQYMSAGDIKNKNTIQGALDALEKEFTPPDKNGTRPEQVHYDVESNWLFGVDFRVANAVRIGVVLNDPNLYGLVIEVKCQESSPLATFNGLKFELLYKKITDTVGMFKAMLRLPELYRTINLGYLSLTIGVMSVEIYTNGDFLIDLGFPHNADFTNSFVLQVDIYIGHGGFYFGVLSSASSKSVPVITDGTFTPVIALGIGLAIGVGRTFDFGIVKGGLSLEVMGIFEGVLAFYKPNKQAIDAGKKEAVYYSVNAIVGIIGQLYLSADLKVITIRASVEIKAYAQIILESYKAMRLALDLSLKLCAKVKVLFFKINFSYSFHQRVEFVIGKDSVAPWGVASLSERRLLCFDGWDLFRPDPLEGEPWEIDFRIVPMYSIQNPYFGGLGMADSNPSYCVAFLGNVNYGQLGCVIEMLTKWMLNHWQGDMIYYEEGFLPELAEQLTYEQLYSFLQNNAVFYVCPDTGEDASDTDVAVFPMLPPITLAWEEQDGSNQIHSLDFWDDNRVPAEYADQITAYFEKLNADPTYESKMNLMDDQTEIPMAQLLFLDYFQILLRSIIQRIGELFETYTCDADYVPKDEEETRRVIAHNGSLMLNAGTLLFPAYAYALQEGDTLSSIAAKYGMSVEDVLADSKDQTQLLRQNSVIADSNYVFENQTLQMSLRKVGALFYSRIHEYELQDQYQSYVESIVDLNPQLTMDWECLSSDGTILTIPTRSEGNIKWKVQRGDTVVRLAKFCAYYDMKISQNTGWDQYMQNMKVENQAEETQILLQVVVRIEGATVDGDLTIDGLFRRLLPDKETGAFGENPLWNQPVLNSVVKMNLHNAKLTIAEPCSVDALLRNHGVTAEELGSALFGNWNAVNAGQQIVLTQLESLSKSDVLKELISEGTCRDFGAMTSRFYLQGLRVPKPNQEETVPLYQMSGQQQTLQSPGTGLWIRSQKGDPGCGWMADAAKEITVTQEQAAQQLPQQNIYYDTTGFQVLPDFCPVPKSYPMADTIQYVHTDSRPNQSVQLLSESMRGEMKGFKGTVDVHNQKGEDLLPKWGVLLPFVVRYDGKDQSCFAVNGADATDRLLLYRMLGASFGELQILYPASQEKGLPKSIVGEPLNMEQTLLMKTNLSVETHMGRAGALEEEESLQYSVSLNEDNNRFLRMLWECSVVGGGGYYLRYQTDQNKSIPLELFKETGEAKLWLLAILPDAAIDYSLVNCAITHDTSAAGEQITCYPNGEGVTMVYQPAFPPGCVGMSMEVAAANEEADDAQGRTRNLFQIVGYTLAGEEDTYMASNDSPPLVPVAGSDDAHWKYTPTIPLYRFVSGENTIYSARNKRASVQMEARDVLGNRAVADEHGTNIVPDYNDLLIGLHEWTGNVMTYKAGGTIEEPLLEIWFTPNSGSEYSKESISNLELALLQLSQEDMQVFVTSTLCTGYEKMLDETEMQELKKYGQVLLNYISGNGPAPDPLRIQYLLLDEQGSKHLPAEIFQVETRMHILRSGYRGECTGAQKAESFIYPQLEETEDHSLSDETFIKMLEGVFPTLRIAKGAQKQNILYGITFGSQGLIKSIQVRPYELEDLTLSRHYALRPLQNSFMTREVEISTALVDVPTERNVEAKVFADIDMEVWARDILSDIERVLSLPYVERAAVCDRRTLDKIIAAKETLAAAITSQLEPLMVEMEQDNPQVARKILQDRLKKSLSKGYATDVVAQYQATVEAEEYIRITTSIGHLTSGAIVQANKLSSMAGEDALCLFVDASLSNKAWLNDQLVMELLEIEYHIMEDHGYETSEWLRLVHPILSTGMEGVSISLVSDLPIPIPKRNCPSLPTLVAQRCIPCDVGEDISNLLKWNYQLTCQCDAVEQDSLHLWIELETGMQVKAIGEEKDLFDYMAQYESVRNDIWNALDSEAGSNFENGLLAFCATIENVARVWADWLMPKASYMSDASISTYECQVRYQFEEKGTIYHVEPLNGSEEVLKTLGAGDPSIRDVTGTLVKVEGSDKIAFNFTIPGLPLYRCHNVTPAGQIVRNKDLYDGYDVNKNFIYVTEKVELDTLHASVVYTDTVALQHIGADDREKIKAILDSLSGALELDSSVMSLNMGVWYAYGLSQQMPELRIHLPITLFPDLHTQQGWKDMVADNIYQWIATEQPVKDEERMEFRIVVYNPDTGGELLYLSKVEV